MTRDTKQAAQAVAVFLLSVIAIPLLTWAFAKYDAANLKVPRYVQDSSVIANRDSLFKVGLMERLDRLQSGQDAMRLRMEQIQCGRRVSEGCR